MTGLVHIAKIREYCDYIEEHLTNVNASWNTVVEKCNDMSFITDECMFWDIHRAVEAHDLSKLSSEEFIPYQQKFFPVGSSDVPINDFDDAWDHHKAHNPHHWETLKGDSDKFEVNCVCMVVDWMAMGLKFGDTAESYYENNKDRIDIPEQGVILIREIFKRLR